MSDCSNVECTSNVYVIKNDLKTDRNFQAKVRGRENIRKMLVCLSGQSWIKGHVNVDDYLDLYLTDLQKKEWDQGKPCAHSMLKYKEKQWGLIKTSEGLKLGCRCYLTECPQFTGCRKDYANSTKCLRPGEGAIKRERDPSIDIPHPEETIEDEKEQRGQESDEIRQTLVDFESEPDDFEGVINSWSPDVTETGQKAIITASTEEKILVQAGPGTGKTYSLLKKLEYMVDEQRLIEADNILVLCFTRAAVQEIRERFQKGVEEGKYSDDLSRLEIRTFDSFATRILIARENDLAGKGYDERIEMAIKELQKDPDILMDMGHLIVDEIQDLVGVRARFVESLLCNQPEHCGFTLLGDSLQGIYDYQVRDCLKERSARELLQWVKSHFLGTIREIKLTGNYRQRNKLNQLSQRARIKLETGEDQGFKDFLLSIDNIPSVGKDYNFLLPLSLEEKIGVLCRTNGEALKLSGFLRQRGINHLLVNQRGDAYLPTWVGKILSSDATSITRAQLVEMLVDNVFWTEELKNSLYGVFHLMGQQKSDRVLDLHILKRQMASGARLPDEFYEYGYDGNLFVSTIHRAKGREFDRVFLLPPWKDRLEEDLFEEAKVYYVGITRARKHLGTIVRSEGREWLKKSERTDRWMELGYKLGGKRRLVSVAVGIEGDADDQGFVDSKIVANPAENQCYLLNNVSLGDRVDIKLDEEKAVYLIYHKEELIGKMSDDFLDSVRQIMREVYNSSTYLPKKLEGLHVECIHTIVRKRETIRVGIAKPYIEKCVWFGINIVGLGKVRWPWDC